MSDNDDLICSTLKNFPICILSKRTIETICVTTAWNELLSNRWLDIFEKPYQNQILETMDSVTTTDAPILLCPTVSEPVKHILFQFHVLNEDKNELLLVLASDVTFLIGNETSNRKYTLLLTELLRHPTYDKRLNINMFTLRDLLHEMTRLINTSLHDDNVSNLLYEQKIQQQLDDIKCISENNRARQDRSLSRKDLRRILEDTSIILGVSSIIEKRFDKNINIIAMVDSDRLSMLLESMLRKIQTLVEVTVNKIIIEAVLLGNKEDKVLQIKYLYAGKCFDSTLVGTDDVSLMIIQGYMELLNAKVTSEQIGSRVIVTLNIPIQTVLPLDADIEENKSIKVLVVDDNLLIRRIVNKYAEKYGHTVFEASNGNEAIEMIQKHKPRIIFLDIDIPIFNGFEVIRRIRKWEKEQNLTPCRIVGVTGFGNKYTKEMIIEAGADTSQEKPLSIERYKMYIDIFTNF